MTNRKIEYWVIPPDADAEYVACMESVLDTYAKPYNPDCPVICMDEQPVQLHQEIRTPLPATAKHGKRVDYEYERAGTACIFMFTEPLVGWREVTVRQTRTKVDWAIEMARLLEGRYANCPQVMLICDNLNTHTKGAFYETFEPERARQLVRRIEFCYTPKHGSWLNMAEIELSVYSCSLKHHIPTEEMLTNEVHALTDERYQAQTKLNWQFFAADARIKLKQLYPSISN
jgi:hypothetical protein